LQTAIREEYKTNVNHSALTLIVAATSVCALAQQSGNTGRVTKAAVWNPPADIVSKAQTVCSKSAGPMSFPECFKNQIAAAAPAEAAEFTRLLYDKSDGDIGILTGLQEFKDPVAAAQVLFPLRANDNYGLLLVNGDPAIINVDDLSKLDRSPLDKDPAWQQLKKHYPNADIWPGDRGGKTWVPKTQPTPEMGVEFIVTYPIINGCHACERIGQVRFAWVFDNSGKFLRTTYVPPLTNGTPPAAASKKPWGCTPQCGTSHIELFLAIHDWITERSHAFDCHLNPIAGVQRAHTLRRSGGDHVSGFERHDARDVAQEHIEREEEVSRGAVLAQLAVHAGLNANATPGIKAICDYWADGTERVEAFSAAPLSIFILQIASGDVV